MKKFLTLLLTTATFPLMANELYVGYNHVGATPYTTGISNGSVTICRWDAGSPTDISNWGGFGNNLPNVPFNYIYGKNTIFGITNDGSCSTQEIKDWPQMHITQAGKKMYLYKITLPQNTIIEYIGQKLYNEYKIDSANYQNYINGLAHQIWALNQITSGKPASEAALASKLKIGYFKPGGAGLDSQYEVQVKGPITIGYTKIGECTVGIQSQYCNKLF